MYNDFTKILVNGALKHTAALMSKLVSVLLLGLLAGCAGTTVQPDQYSGYLGNSYSLLQETRDPLGEALLSYTNSSDSF